ncbi:hypothetical protein V1L54_27370 [Streptomyces sp. TRM 70361]|uniref:hypothetical protein n=1 Tax=Streptomyces sp. TRM 70361 TaxID=3116553 RepID=UPI002E7B7A6D|nr:hypothetical protein [Streptomyces sp. TRM 70361]MEE1943082.1 hypothetical protein [Streptomyces sp. TRM 70361]
MPHALRAAFDAGMQRMAADPYGHGSTPVKGDESRREATVGSVVVRFYVSDAVLTVTVVRVVYI